MVRMGGLMSCAAGLENTGPPPLKLRFSSRGRKLTASGKSAIWLLASAPSGWSLMSLHHYWLRPADPHLPTFKSTTWKDQDGLPGAHVHVDAFSLSTPDFVTGALSGKLQWYGNGQHGIILLVLRED
ncbi:hypothetical protein JH26_21770 [Microvirga sp. BSC39]|nr:hypothetical protein JH26_21770 [Microvirga sp. BSC39]